MQKEKKLKIISLIPYKILPALNGGQKGIALFLKYLAQQTVTRAFFSLLEYSYFAITTVPQLSVIGTHGILLTQQ
jgi:hypothetical protein